MRNWGRNYRILIGVPGQEGYVLGGDVAGRDMHIKFDLQKADTQASNSGKLTIYNLNDEHKAMLDLDGCVVEIRAGYKDTIGGIFIGGVYDTTEDLEDGDRSIEIDLVDGVFNYDQIGSVSLNGVVPCSMALEAIAEQMGFESIVITEKAQAVLEEAKYDNGYAYVGKLRAGLQKITDKAGCTFTTQNGVLQVHVAGEPINTLAFVLNAESGLIGIPKKIRIGDSGTSSSSTTRKESADAEPKGLPGYQVEFFINGAIGVNDIVKLESKSVSGYFLVHSMAYRGDNYGDDWFCIAELIEVKE